LNRLSQTHLICQNSIEIVIIKADHPAQSKQLIRFQLASFEQHGLLWDFFDYAVGDFVINFAAIS
jgi:hypothetical protein